MSHWTRFYNAGAKIFEKRPVFCSAILCFLVLILRERKRLKYAHLWAEDGALFLISVLNDGFQSLFEPYAGYFHTVSRIMALIGVYIVHLDWYPVFTTLVCLAITSFIYAMIASKSYEYLIPQLRIRVLVAILFCIVPAGSAEVLGNPTNIHWVLFYYLWFLALKPPQETFKKFELAFVALALFSMGESVVIVPMILWRLYLQNKHNKTAFSKASRSDYLFLAGLIGMLVIHFVIREHKAHASTLEFSRLFKAVTATLSQHLVYLPILGPHAYFDLANKINTHLNRGIGLTVLCYLVWILFKHRGIAGRTLIIGLGCAVGIPVLTFIVRPDSVHWFMRTILPDPLHFLMRYYYILGPAAVLFWGVVVGGSQFKTNTAKISGILLAVLCIYNSSKIFKIAPLGKDRDWKEDVSPLISALETGCPANVIVKIYPEPWTFQYFSKKPESCQPH